MKKNLRIVSAAAAALLAVAPVAATAVVSAPTSTVQADAFIKKGDKVLAPKNIETTYRGKAYTIKKGDQLEVVNNPGKENTTVKVNGKYTMSVKTADLKGAQSVVAPTANGNQTVTVKNTAGSFYTYQDGKFVAGANLPGGSITVSTKVYRENGEAYYAVIGSNGRATGQFVKASDVTVATPADTSSEHITSDIFNSVFENDANVAVNINATASKDENGQSVNWFSVLNGQIVYTDAKGAQHTALLHGDNNTVVTETSTGKKVSSLQAGVNYTADFNKVTINLGNAAAGSKVKFVLPRTAAFKDSDKGYYNVKTVTVDSNGIADLGTVYAKFYAYNPTDLQEVHFYSAKTGNVVTSGSVNLHAVNGKISLYALYHAMTGEYQASQLAKGTSSTYAANRMLPVAVQNDLRDQLKKQNITVDDNGNFTAPASFTVNMNAKSIYNGATATLPVTVTVDNAAQTPAANETTKNVTIMHIATIYDKNGKATHELALRAYNSVSVVSDPVSLKDEKGNDAGKFYKLAGKDQYIKVGNVDGTSRSLKHNSYVYKS
ncbi:SLAP domain-containing protein, partial [Lactobacillus kitasatonis]|uniref:SLAP domain-containing protein n=1 Tax=Lactobacillus kitasatonis TaxID=237446 RepID=UPI0026ED56C8